jgi:hypothetical protein
MKKYLLLGLVLLAANGLTPARAADSCSTLVLTNASGSPPVVQGTTVDFNDIGFPLLSAVLLDGSIAWEGAQPSLPPDQLTVFSGGIGGLSYGSHTLQAGYDPDGCIINFTTVPAPPPPPPPPAIPGLSDVGNGTACPSDLLEFGPVSGATSYQIWVRQIRPTPGTSALFWSGAATQLRITLSAGQYKAYQAAACNSNGCSALSQPVYILEGACQ